MVKVISTTTVGEEESTPGSRSGVASSGGNPEEQRVDVELHHLEGAEEEKGEIVVHLIEGPRDEQARLVRELHQRMDEQTEMFRAYMARLEVTEERISRLEETAQRANERQNRSHQAAKKMAKEYFRTGISVGFLMGVVMMLALTKRK